MPSKLDKLPKGTKFTFLRKISMFEGAETVLYSVFMSQTKNFFKITTDELPDVMVIPANSYGGGELYRKLDDGTYLRIIELRMNGNQYGIYYVDSENISSKFFDTEVTESGLLNAVFLAYRLYWSNLNKNQ